MRILGINTATARTEVALVEVAGEKSERCEGVKGGGDGAAGKTGGATGRANDGATGGATGRAKIKTLFTKAWLSNRDEAEKVVPAIAAALKRCPKGPAGEGGLIGKNTPDLVLVVTGPGAFTGLRIGVTAANTLAFMLKATVLGVSTYDFLRARIPQAQAKKTALLLKAGGDFAAVLLPGEKHPGRIAANELKSFFRKKRFIRSVVGDMSPAERKKFPLPAGLTWIDEKLLKRFPAVVADFAAKKIPHKKMAEPRYLLPPKITLSKKPVFAGLKR